MPSFRSVALSVSLVFVAAACRQPSQAGQTTETTAADVAPSALAVPASTPPPTTAPVVDSPPPGPTPITLSGGRGIQVPTAGPEPAAPLEGTGPEEARAAPTASAATVDPAPTVVPSAAPTTVAPPVATSAPPPSDSTDPAVAVANGAEVYTLNCARCHGENGMGSFQASGLFGVGGRYGTGSLIAELTSGHPYTFGFGDELSSAEIADVVAYVRATFG